MEWRSSHSIIVPEQKARGLEPGDRVPVELMRQMGIVALPVEKPRFSSRIREWWLGVMKLLFGKRMVRRQLRIEEKARSQMASKIANAWKNDE